MIAFSERNKTFHVVCRLCGTDYSILLNEQDFDDWIEGKAYIQDVLDYLTAAERELLISATCDKCWKQLFGEGYDE